MCVCACVPLSNLQFIILQFTIYALNFNFCSFALLWAPLSTVIIMFHFAIQVFALRQVLLSQVRASEREGTTTVGIGTCVLGLSFTQANETDCEHPKRDTVADRDGDRDRDREREGEQAQRQLKHSQGRFAIKFHELENENVALSPPGLCHYTL